MEYTGRQTDTPLQRKQIIACRTALCHKHRRLPLTIYEQAAGEESYTFVEARWRFARFYTDQERYAEAEALLIRLLSLSERDGGVSALERADYLEHFASVLTRTGREGEAAGIRLQVKTLWQQKGHSRDDL